MSPSSSSAPSMLPGRAVKVLAVLALSLSLGACDYIASFSKPKQTPEEAKAEGIALGAGCRQAGQSLEDCYARNPAALKAGIFAGWKDMHEYMAAKGISTVAPLPPPVVEEAKPDADPDAGKDERTLRREKRERERAERENGGSKDSASKSSKDSSKDSKSKDSDSPRKSRDDSSSKK